MSRSFDFYRDEEESNREEEESNREEEERQRYLLEEQRYYMEQMELLSSDDIVDESSITEEDLFRDILEDERNDDDTTFE